MRHYENLVIVKPTLTEEEIKSNLETIDEIITSGGGEIVAADKVGIKKLAYTISKNSRGYFYIVYYKAEPGAINEIERRFRINENLLRFITVKYDNKKEIAAWEGMVKRITSPETKTSEPKKEAPKEETPVVAPEEAATEAKSEEAAS